MSDALNFISVEDLSNEIQKHHDSDLLRTLLADLRSKRIDLKEFCKRVRMLIGATVLVATVKGLQAAQKEKLNKPADGGPAPPAPGAAAGGAPAPGAPQSLDMSLPPPAAATAASPAAVAPASSPAVQPAAAPATMATTGSVPPPAAQPSGCASAAAGTSAEPAASTAGAASSGKIHPREGGGTKLLIHALLCNRPGVCTMPECNTMKGFLQRVEAHTKSCNFSNLPGGQTDCANCQKWQQMVKLREHYRHKLIKHHKEAKAKSALPTSLFPPASQPQQKAQLMPPPAVPSVPHPTVPTTKPSSAIPTIQPPPIVKMPSSQPAAVALPPAAAALPKLTSSPFGNPIAGPFGRTISSDGPATELSHAAPAVVAPNPNLQPAPLPVPQAKPKPKPKPEPPIKREPVVRSPRSSVALPPESLPDEFDFDAAGDEEDDLDALLEAELFKKEQRLDGAHGKRPAHEAGLAEPPAKQRKPAAEGKKPQQAARKPRAAVKPHGKPHPFYADGGGGGDDDGFGLPPLSSSGDGLAFAELHAGTTDQKFMEIIEKGQPLLAGGWTASEADTKVLEGMHLVVDTSRPSPAHGGVVPTAHQPLVVAPKAEATNVAMVEQVHADGSCDVRYVCNCHAAVWPPCEASLPRTSCHTCGAGRIGRHVQPTQRQIVCSICLDVNLAHQQPQLRCSGCERLIKNLSHYHRETELHREVKLCSACFDDLKHGQQPQLLQDLELRPATFQRLTWKASEEEDYDHYVQCEGACKRWYHFTCCMYPDPAQLPHQWQLEKQRFHCPLCRARVPPADPSLRASAKLFSIVDRKATQLPRCQLSDEIEDFVAAELKQANVTLSGLSVRLVSSKQFTYQAVSGMRQRYGDSFPNEFPYKSRALLAFQTIRGHDVAFFAMYVQEYGAHCPQPNTNRTYISYLDSVRYLETDPPEQRTLVYHAMINGYLRHACARGFQHAHIWVAPPQAGDEYIFHCRPRDPRFGERRMGMSKLRSWYEKMLHRAEECGIVQSFTDIQTEIEHLTSIRDFPMFEGDFFPEQLQQLLMQPPAEGGRAAASHGGSVPTAPGLKKQESFVLMEQIRKQVRSVRKRFLVATLNTERWRREPGAIEPEPAVSNDLVDARMSFLGQCQNQHWQFDNLSRAHYTTMMLLARLGGLDAQRRSH